MGQSDRHEQYRESIIIIIIIVFLLFSTALLQI